MALMNQQQLVVQQIQNQYIPDEGPKAIPLLLDFSGAVDTYDLDLELLQSKAFLSLVQTLYIDCSNSGSPLTVTVGSSQIVIAKAATQGYYNVLCPNPVKLKFQSPAGGSKIPVYLINVAVPGSVWPTT